MRGESLNAIAFTPRVGQIFKSPKCAALYGPKYVHELNAENMYEKWLSVISEGDGSSPSAKRRNFAVILRKIMSEAQSKFEGKMTVNAQQCLLTGMRNSGSYGGRFCQEKPK
jgi:hypothetical protein